jgi:hypothetical protein
VGQWVRSSFLFRWLTKEPDPEVIVIDLTETRTVGPILLVLDRIIRQLDRARPFSLTNDLAGTLLNRFRRRPVRVASLGLLAFVLLGTIGSILAGSMNPVRLGLFAVLAVLSALGFRVEDSWAELLERRSVRLLIKLLEPPEPPEETEGER